MSIVPLLKVTLVGVLHDKEALLQQLQQLGCLHVTPLTGQQREQALPEGAERLRQALKYLLACPGRRKQVRHDAHFDAAAIVRQANDNAARFRELRDRHDFLVKRMAELQPWGDFQLPPADALQGYKLWFYQVPHYQMAAVRQSGLIWQVVHQDRRYQYVAVIAREEPDAAAMPVARTHTGARSLSQLEHERHTVELEIEALEAERQSLTRWIYLLLQNHAQLEDQARLAQVAEQTLDAEAVFALQGWLPAERREELTAFAQANGVALELAPPTAAERPPTLLRNPERLAGGEALVSFYQMPGYRTWDPSRVLFFSFALFFAVILADAGYALLLWVGLLLYRRRWRRTRQGRRLYRLGQAMAVLALGYGVLVGSYFGAPPPWPALAALQLIDLSDFDAMMRFSVLIGVGHIGLANAISAWQRRGSPTRWEPVGWLCVLAGGTLWGLWPAAQGQLPGSLLIIVGLLLVLLFASARPWRRDQLGWRLLEGLRALTGLSKAFGDVLSYLRLFALGLASASLALTFNQLAQQVAAAYPGIGVLLQLLILLLGHLLNFVLGVVSGVVHGLRLNLIEFYNWSLSDEGYAFRPFAKKEMTSWTT